MRSPGSITILYNAKISWQETCAILVGFYFVLNHSRLPVMDLRIIPVIGMGDTSTKISIPILEVLDTWVLSTFLKN